MSLVMRWVAEDELDKVAETRLLCYGAGRNDLQRMRDMLRDDRRAQAGDYLLAERDGRPVGTATSLSLTMYIRGSAFPCQGVAWVGAIRTERRKAASINTQRSAPGGPPSRGVASSIMSEVLRAARDRQLVLTTLMPFRTSFYEHFGYGPVERRCEWTVPLSILPAGDFDGMHILELGDRPAVIDCQHRMAHRGQCDFARMPEAWDQYLADADAGFFMVDRPDPAGPVEGWLNVRFQDLNGRSVVRVVDHAYDTPGALLRQLHFLASLRDQHSAAILTMPADVPLNMLLSEHQVPHRPVSHAAAEMRSHNRMQIRILDHRRLLDGLHVPDGYRGQAVVAVHECEGAISRFLLEIADGSLCATPTDASPDVQCPDRVWAAIVSGEMPSTAAAQLGLVEVTNERALQTLRAFSDGPLPFCRDYF